MKYFELIEGKIKTLFKIEHLVNVVFTEDKRVTLIIKIDDEFNNFKVTDDYQRVKNSLETLEQKHKIPSFTRNLSELPNNITNLLKVVK